MNFRMVADVRSMSNYHPYGSLIDAGSWSGSSYNFGYNGMLKEGIGKDISHTHFRNLSSGDYVGWWSPDPLESNFPSVSPYISMDGNPILKNDENGDCTDCGVQGGVTASSDGELSIGAQVNLGGSLGNYNGSIGGGITYYTNMYNTNKSGFEFRTSAMVGFNDKNFSIDLGTNNWSGIGQMKEFSQRTGVMSIGSGDFKLMYENDGTPMQWLGLGDGNDSYRTNSVSVTVGEFSVNLRMITGLRNEDSFYFEKEMDDQMNLIQLSPLRVGKFKEIYDYGLVEELGNQYRMGELTLNYAGIGVGVNSEWIRHSFQNKVAHSWFQSQRYFEMTSENWKPKLNLTNYKQSQYSIWGR